MKAYHNKQEIKDKYLKRVKDHRLADDLIHGIGWDRGKGCAVGCTLEKYDHSLYPDELGIPEILARLEDIIFEGLENKRSQLWPERFLQAIKVGSDLSKVGPKFLLAITKRNYERLNEKWRMDLSETFIRVANVVEDWIKQDVLDNSDAWAAAQAAAEAAARSAKAAARSAQAAARSAEAVARSAEAVTNAANAAAGSAEADARSAQAATWSANAATRSASWSDEAAKRSDEYKWQAETLIKLIEECD